MFHSEDEDINEKAASYGNYSRAFTARYEGDCFLHPGYVTNFDGILNVYLSGGNFSDEIENSS